MNQKTEYYGKKTYGKDKILYKSRFEAEFADKFLYPLQIDYEYEKSYSKNSKHKCDFYIPKFDLYIECVYGEILNKKAYQLYNNKILKLNVSYQEKNEAKKLGAFWNPEKKFWYLPENEVNLGKERLALEKYMNYDDKKIIYESENQITEDYADKLSYKMSKYNVENIMVVHNSDLNESSFYDILRIRCNALFKELYEDGLIPTNVIKLKKKHCATKRYKLQMVLNSYNELSEGEKNQFKKLINLKKRKKHYK